MLYGVKGAIGKMRRKSPGALQNQMGWEYSLKKWGVIGWGAKFWFNIRGHWVRMLLLIFQWAQVGICKKSSKMAKMINLSMKLKQKVAFCSRRMQKNRGLWVRAIEEPTFHQKMWDLWVIAETTSKNMGSLGDSSSENRRSLEPYIPVTSILESPPGKSGKRGGIRKNLEKEVKIGKKGKNRESPFTLPLLTDRAGYATEPIFKPFVSWRTLFKGSQLGAFFP